MIINSSLIEKAVYNLCQEANISLPLEVYKLFDEKEILENAYLAYKNKTPLCQDTGQVLVFIKIGQNVQIQGDFIEKAINKGIEKCYKDNFFRKSVVKDAFDRKNTQTNTPAIIYYEIKQKDILEIDVLIKGGGAENQSFVKAFNPICSQKEIFAYINEEINKKAKNCCPPLFLGIGVGGTIDYASFLSKKALFEGKNVEIKNEFIKNAKMLTAQSHIASMIVAVSINCHSNRHSACVIRKNNIEYKNNKYLPKKIKIKNDLINIKSTDIDQLRKLKIGQEIFISGEIYAARDVAHKRIIKMIKNKEKLPFDLENAIIFYAGPCPIEKEKNSIGPTTSKRMDEYTPILYDKGIFATIGKGERSEEVKKSIKKNKGIYFSVKGGIASLIATKIEKITPVAFEELDAEAVYKLQVKDLPIKVEII